MPNLHYTGPCSLAAVDGVKVAATQRAHQPPALHIKHLLGTGQALRGWALKRATTTHGAGIAGMGAQESDYNARGRHCGDGRSRERLQRSQ